MSKRIYMNGFDDWGCGYYRAKMPVYNCFSELSKHGISVSLDKDLHSDENEYDAYILHRIPVENSIFFMQSVQKKGKKFILEMDDDIFSIPEWTPSEEYRNPKWSLKRAIDMSDEIWVSTDVLAEAVNRPSKTHVLPNLIDYNAFPQPLEPTDPIRILWMGSMWHDKDLEQVVNPIIKLLEEYKEKIQVIFWGCLPTAFADYKRVPGQNMAVLKQTDKFGKNLLYLEGIPFKFYFDSLIKVRPYIGIAPLYDCKFNDSRSNIKYLEYSMAGAATIAVDCPPYKCISHNEDGLLVEPHDEEGWYNALKRLIEDKKLHDELVLNAREKVFKQYSWQSQNKKQLWIDAFKNIV